MRIQFASESQNKLPGSRITSAWIKSVRRRFLYIHSRGKYFHAEAVYLSGMASTLYFGWRTTGTLNPAILRVINQGRTDVARLLLQLVSSGSFLPANGILPHRSFGIRIIRSVSDAYLISGFWPMHQGEWLFTFSKESSDILTWFSLTTCNV